MPMLLKLTNTSQMMKTLFALFNCCFFMLASVTAQLTYQTSYDNGSYDKAVAVIQLHNNDLVMGGDTYNNTGFYEGYLMKTNEQGDTLWVRKYTTPGHLFVTDCIQARDHGYLLAGDLMDSVFTDRNMFIIKTDSSGIPEWSRSFSGPEYDNLYSLTTLSDSSIILTGNTVSYTIHNLDAQVLKLDPAGNIIWSRQLTHGWGSTLRGHRVFGTDDGGFVITGEMDTITVVMGNKILVVKFDSTDQVQWSNTYKGIYGSSIGNGIQTSDHGYLVAGRNYNWIAGDTFINHAYLLKLDSIGDIQWSKKFESPYNDDGIEAVETSDGYAMLGISTGFSGNNLVGFNMFIVKTDTNGVVEWNKYYGGNVNSADMAKSFIKANDGGFIACGESSYMSYDSYLLKTDEYGNVNCNGYDFPLSDSIYISTMSPIDLTLSDQVYMAANMPVTYTTSNFVKLSPCTYSIPEYGEPTVIIYPNPCVDLFNITGLQEDDEIALYNLSGQLVRNYPNTQVFGVEGLVSGMYVVCIQHANKSSHYKKLIVH